MKLLLATNNKGKVVEFQRILEPLGIKVILPAEIGVSGDVEETGNTFIANAKLKATELFEKTGIPTMADDSGLCIEALGGRPGVKTARYGGGVSYPEKFQLLFKELENPKNRNAFFVCSIYCILDKNKTIEITEKCEGKIGFEAKGNDGFGFDPIFFINGTSFAELSAREKDAASHRGKALRELAKQLGQII